MRSTWRRRFCNGLVIFVLLAMLLPAPFAGSSVAYAQTTPQPNIDEQVQAILTKMRPEERVGQLFLVTFNGHQVGVTSQIYDLIINHHIGGVILKSANDNFSGPDTVIQDTWRLTNDLQSTAWSASQMELQDPLTKSTYTPQFIPLFIGTTQGDGSPDDQILNGLTPIPSPMAIGSTWKPDLAGKVGTVLGQELEALGINLLLGPSLDVSDVIQTETGDDLGTNTFGGDPYWVGEMGKAYISGLHTGSDNRLAVIAQHFPGRGGSDRPPETEVATVRKSLDQLKQIELAPFFAVTGNSPSPESTTDGLLASHIRYQGFQGNIRATTRPFSFDPTAFDQVMSLPPLSQWRLQGGIVISDDLGSQAVRKFYDPNGQSFDARQIARSAFLAGNDLLYAGNLISTNDPDSYTTILHTLDFFAQKYREDPAFAQRVDVSVTRVLKLKLKMYSNFALEQVNPAQDGLSIINQSSQLVFDVAQKAGTLLSPDPADLSAAIPRAPDTLDRIVFISDVTTERQCTQCPDQNPMAVDALQNAVLRLYGPKAAGQVVQFKLSSYSFLDLLNLLNNSGDQKSKLQEDLGSADWVVVSFLDVNNSRPESLALRRLLAEQQALVRTKRVIAFAFNAPYYLDATDISKLTAYYALYDTGPAFVDVAARLLFQELVPSGNPPVSVPGIGYDLINAVSPDPAQVIPLLIDTDALKPANPSQTTTPTLKAALTQTLTPQPTISPAFRVGDMIPVRTGVILDRNHNPVPDGTVVRFIFTTGGEAGTTQQVDTTTTAAIARAAFRIQAPGLLDIRVISDPANVSDLLRLNIPQGEAATVIAITPTSAPSQTPLPTPTPTMTPTPTATPTPPPPLPRAGFSDWMLSMLVIWVCMGGGFYLTLRQISVRWGVRVGLLMGAGGLAAYLIYNLAGIYSVGGTQSIRILGLIIVVVIGCLLGGAAGVIWWISVGDRLKPRRGRGIKASE